MSIRISTFAAAAALALTATGAFAQDGLTSTVDGPRAAIGVSQADAAATQSPGTVGAMHHAVAGVATSEADVQRQGGNTTAAAVRWLAAPAQPGS